MAPKKKTRNLNPVEPETEADIGLGGTFADPEDQGSVSSETETVVEPTPEPVTETVSEPEPEQEPTPEPEVKKAPPAEPKRKKGKATSLEWQEMARSFSMGYLKFGDTPPIDELTQAHIKTAKRFEQICLDQVK